MSERLIYGVEERPARWWESVLFGWQHTLVDISPFVLPLAIASALGMTAAETAQLISFGLVAMGVATLIQTTIGNRLPIIQGPSATLVGTLAPVAGQLGAPAMWGGVLVGGVVETILGATRLVGLLRRFLPASVSGAVIVTIGLALGQLAIRLSVGDGSGSNFAWSSSVIVAIFVLQIAGRRWLGGLLSRGAIFVVIWTFGLGLGSLFGQVDWALVAGKPWFALPELFPYGGPGFGGPGLGGVGRAWAFPLAGVLVILVGYFGSMVESLGDYAATCEVAGVEYRKKHMNRGIFAEGLGSIVSAVLGGLPCTSYTQNIGIIAATRVASRFVVQIAALFLLAYGLCPKFGALLVAMPRPVLGGVFVVVCGMIALSGIRLIASAAATAGTGLVVGVTLIVSTTLPAYVRSTLGQEWLDDVSPIVSLLLSNSVVLAVLVGVATHLLVEALAGTFVTPERAEP